MELSVIIPTRNRAETLEKSLESITKQTFPHNYFEVIVVDNGSTDNTKEVINSFQPKIKNLRYFYEKTPGLHVGRHKGLKEAIADILVYADDDIEALPTWLEGIWEAFQDPVTVLVGGKNLPNFESEPPLWIKKMWNKKIEGGNVLGYLSILDLGSEIKEIHPYYVFGCNFSVRKKILEEAKGFHPDGMPQELIKYRGDGESHVSRYVLENGYKAMYNPKASVYHLVSNSRMKFEYFMQRAYNQGISDSFSKIRYSNNINSKKSICRETKNSAYICNWGILKFMIMVPFKVIYYIKNPRIAILKYKINQAYNKGFKYHQNEVKRDKSLLEWVKKDNYLDI